MIIDTNLRETIKARRQALDLTQIELAQRVGVHNLTIHRLEKEGQTSEETLAAVCKELNLKLQQKNISISA